MMTASDWIDHWTQRAPLISPDRLRELIDSIAEDESQEEDAA
jgi:hypothetical protein